MSAPYAFNCREHFQKFLAIVCALGREMYLVFPAEFQLFAVGVFYLLIPLHLEFLSSLALRWSAKMTFRSWLKRVSDTSLLFSFPHSIALMSVTVMVFIGTVAQDTIMFIVTCTCFLEISVSSIYNTDPVWLLPLLALTSSTAWSKTGSIFVKPERCFRIITG